MINLIIKPFYTFFIETEVQNLIGPEDYGIYFSLFNLSYILQILLDMGIHNYGSQYIAKDPVDSHRFLSLALTTKAFLTLVFAVAILLVAGILGYNHGMKSILYLVSINQILISLIFFFRSSLAAIGCYRMNSIISVLDKLIMIGLFVYVLHLSDTLRASFDLFSFIGIRMGAYLVTCLVAYGLLYFVGKQKVAWHWDARAAWELLRRSLPFAIIVIFMGLSNRTDAVMLERLLADNGLQSGIYAASYRIFYAMNTLGFLFSMLLLPMFAHLLIADKSELLHLVELSLKTILALAIGAVAMVYMLRHTIMTSLYKSDALLYGTGILMSLCVTFILASVIYILGTLLTANARMRHLNILFAISTVINVVINYYLIPIQGAYGAAMATLYTHVFVMLGQIFLSYHIIPLRLPMKSIVSIIVFACSAGGVAFWGDMLIDSLVSKCIFMIAALALLGYFTRMLDMKLLYHLLHNKAEK